MLAADANEYFRTFHTTVEALAEIATAAHPKLLVLYHLVTARAAVALGGEGARERALA